MLKRSAAIAVLCLRSAGVAAQQQAKGSCDSPKTAWGDPDLPGIWPSTDMVGVPFERPAELAGRSEVSDKEFAERGRSRPQQRAAADTETVVSTAPRTGDGTGPPSHWLEWGKPSRQASLVVAPADGRLPPMTPEGQQPRGVAEEHLRHVQRVQRPHRPRTVRSLHHARRARVDVSGHLQQRQPDLPDAGLRRHPLRDDPRDARDPARRPAARSSPAIRSYMGDARGHWEGNTLVVETTNFNGKTGAQANGNLLMTSDALELIERFTRTGPDTIQYEVTVNDPKTWTRPWGAAFPLRRDPGYRSSSTPATRATTRCRTSCRPRAPTRSKRPGPRVGTRGFDRCRRHACDSVGGHGRREARVAERLADHPVRVEVHLPVVLVAAVRPDAEHRPGRRELQDVHVRRRRRQHVGDRGQPLLQQADGARGDRRRC